MENNEKILQSKIAEYLSKYFHVELEVNNINRKSRIDIVIVHKTDTQRKYPIGIEVKLDAKKRGKDLAKWIKQSSRYAGTYFVNYGKLLIITYPQISGEYLREGVKMNNHEQQGDFGQANNIGTFLSEFSIGELQKYKHHTGRNLVRIVYKGQLIWDAKDNILRINNYKRLVK